MGVKYSIAHSLNITLKLPTNSDNDNTTKNSSKFTRIEHHHTDHVQWPQALAVNAPHSHQGKHSVLATRGA